MKDEVAYIISIALVFLMKIVCFILGFLTIRLGYKLISSGVRGQFKFSTKLGGLKADLASVSPGLLFVLLGIILIGFAMFTDKEVHLAKGPTNTPQDEKKIRGPLPSDPFKDSTFYLNNQNYENTD